MAKEIGLLDKSSSLGAALSVTKSLKFFIAMNLVRLKSDLDIQQTDAGILIPTSWK